MAYTPPAGGAVDFDLTGAYTAIQGDAIEFRLGDPGRVCEFFIPQPGGSIDLDLTGAYTPPAAGTMALEFADVCYPDENAEPPPEPPPDWFMPSPQGFSPHTRAKFLGEKPKQRHNATRWVDNEFKPRHVSIKRDQMTAESPQTRAKWGILDVLNEHRRGGWQIFTVYHDLDLDSGWGEFEKFSQSRRVLWGKFQAFDCDLDTPYIYPPLKDQHRRIIWDHSIKQVDPEFSTPYRYPPPEDEHHMTQWGDQVYQKICVRAYDPPAGGVVNLDLNQASRSDTDFTFDILTYDPRCTQQRPGGNRDTNPSYPKPPLPPKNAILQVYFIMHTITVVKLPERSVIEVKDLSLQLDIDSWSWLSTLNLVNKADFDLVKPGAGGVQEIEVNIDGYIWEFIIEKYRDNRQFNRTGYTINGRSKTAYLAAPYKLPASRTETALKTANQLIDIELLNTGFSVNYNTEDWLVDAGAFSYQNATPMQAVLKVAGSIGGVVLPDKRAKQITIHPRYRISPWDWPMASAAVTITSDIIRSISGDWQPRPEINAVYVSGRTQGVNCFVKRTGTAGDQLGRQVIDNLITHADAGRERGRNVISDRGNQELMTIELPLLQSGQVPGIYDPGELLEIDEGGGNVWRGIVVKSQIQASIKSGAITASQKITIERHHGNN